jgi:hypothetical protein
MFTSSSVPYIASVVKVAQSESCRETVHQDILALPGFFDDVLLMRSLLCNDITTLSCVVGQDGKLSSPISVQSGVLYK